MSATLIGSAPQCVPHKRASNQFSAPSRNARRARLTLQRNPATSLTSTAAAAPPAAATAAIKDWSLQRCVIVQGVCASASKHSSHQRAEQGTQRLQQQLGDWAGPPVLVLCGVSGCGKSETGQLLAAALGCCFYEGDEFHPPQNVAKMARGVPLTDEDRWPWLDALAEVISHHADTQEPAVVSCSALTRAYRDRLVGPQPQGPGMRRAGVALFILLDPPRAELERRLSDRRGPRRCPAARCWRWTGGGQSAGAGHLVARRGGWARRLPTAKHHRGHHPRQIGF